MAQTLAKQGVRTDRLVVGWLLVSHALALTAPFFFSWSGLALFFLLYYLTSSLGIGLGFHRLLCHRSLVVKPWVEATLATLGTLALQGGPLAWVAHHRMHHGNSDTARDPHDATRGFWFSHVGWLFRHRPEFDDEERQRRFARDIASNRYYAWLSKDSVGIGMQVVLGLLLLAIGGWSWMLWGVFLRVVVVYHVTWLVNSAAHKWGYRNYQVDDLARNNWWVALLAFGEGWHNNHHAQPEAVHVQHRWWEWDMTWWAVRGMHALGLVSRWNLPRKSSAERVDATISGADAPVRELARQT